MESIKEKIEHGKCMNGEYYSYTKEQFFDMLKENGRHFFKKGQKNRRPFIKAWSDFLTNIEQDGISGR